MATAADTSHSVSAGDILDYVAPVSPATRCEVVAELLTREPGLFALPIVDEAGNPLRLLNRFRLLERLSQRFGRELLLRRPIIECVDTTVMLVDERTPIEEIGARLFDGDRTHILDGFIVTRAGTYLGIGTGVTLTRALSDLTVARARTTAEIARRQTAAKNAFVANVSHEIRTPLNGVIGVTSMLADTPLTPAQRSLVDVLRASSDGLMALVDNVLDFSKIEAGQLELEAVSFDLHDLIDDCLQILRVRAAGKDIRVVAVLGASLPRRATGDPGRLRQVLLNLGGNAVKFTKAGHVAVYVDLGSLDDRTARVAFRVEDTGIGVPPEKLDRLFRPFSQVDASTSREYGGTGLGLVICRDLIARMGGTISVRTEPGRGSTFEFSLDLAVGALDREESTPTDAPTRSPGTEGAARVLLAEDNAVNQLVARGMLERLGCEVDIVEDGAAAVAALRRRSYDLVLMDCNMPGVDGFEATRQIRGGAAGDGCRTIPIVALTASATTDSARLCADVGMNGFLPKPIAATALRRALGTWLPSQPREDTGRVAGL
jgi:signal transduction histidine kinase/ActR/RegA family two-component response regulator